MSEHVAIVIPAHNEAEGLDRLLPSLRQHMPNARIVVVDDGSTDGSREVARRLAHEIKNPLTPIQLSAERIRRKYLEKIAESDREPLDRATRTIATQVESMKSMVDAFSE